MLKPHKLIAFLSTYLVAFMSCARGATTELPAQLPPLKREMFFSRESGTGPDPHFCGNDPDLHVSGVEAISTAGFMVPASQTSEECYVRIATIPPGYKVAYVYVKNHVDPTDIAEVEHTPRYKLYLDESSLRGWIWLPRRDGGRSTDLHLSVSINLIRDDLQKSYVESGNALQYNPDSANLIYARDVISNHLILNYIAPVQITRDICNADDAVAPADPAKCPPIGHHHSSHHHKVGGTSMTPDK